jgi:hypothetical protein
MNSKVEDSYKQGETWCVFDNKLVVNWLNLNLSLAGLSWPLFIGGQVLRNRSGYNVDYNMISYSDYDYTWAYLSSATTQTGPRSTKITGLDSYTHTSNIFWSMYPASIWYNGTIYMDL